MMMLNNLTCSLGFYRSCTLLCLFLLLLVSLSSLLYEFMTNVLEASQVVTYLNINFLYGVHKFGDSG